MNSKTQANIDYIDNEFGIHFVGDTFTFGKYKGQSVKSVFTVDKSKYSEATYEKIVNSRINYGKWFLNNVNGNEAIKKNIRRYILLI